MSDEQARELESRLECEILRWTAQKASNALNGQIGISWRAIRDLLDSSLALGERANAAGN